MTLRRWLPLLLCLLLLAGCASTESLPPPAENNPLSKAPPVKGAVTLYTYDGRSVNAQWITDSGRSAALVAALSAVNAPGRGSGRRTWWSCLSTRWSFKAGMAR